MMMANRAKIYFLIFSVFTILIGFGRLGDGINHPWPRKVTYDQFMANPAPGYYDVSGGYVDLGGNILPNTSSDGYLVPFRKIGAPASDRVRAYAYITDSSIVRQIDRINNAAGRPTTPWGMSHDAQTGPVPNTVLQMDVSGMVLQNNYYDDGSSGSSSSNYRSSEPDYSAYLTIRTDQHPNILLGFGMIIAGFVMLIGSLASFGIHLDFRGLKEGQRPKTPIDYDGPLAQQPSTYGQAPPPPYTPYPQQPAPPQAYQPYPQQPYPQQPAAPYQQPYPQQPTPPPYPQQAPIATQVQPPQQEQAPPPPQPQEPAPKAEPPKQDAEMERLKELKAFDPFAE